MIPDLVSISDVCELVTDGTHYTPPDLGDGVPFLTVKDMSFDGSLDFVGSAKIASAEFEKAASGNSAPMCGDVLFSKDGTVGKVSVVTGERKFAVLSSIAILRPDPNAIDPIYLASLLRSPLAMRQANQSKTGSALRRIILKDLKRVRFPLPPLPEQRRIAAILDKADALRQKRRAAIAKLDQLLQSVFLEMFGDPVTNPRNWPLAPLGQLCDVRDGTHESPQYVAEGKPLITSKNLVSGRVDVTDAKLISPADFESINKRSGVSRGDLLMPMIGTIGNPVLVENEPDYAIKNVALLRMVGAEINTSYLHYLLCTHYFDWVSSKSNRGGTQKFIALGDLRALPIPIPSTALQAEFEKASQSLCGAIDRGELQLAKLETLVNSIQQRVFIAQL